MPKIQSIEETVSEINHELGKEALKLRLVKKTLSTMQLPERVSIDDVMGCEYLIEDVITRIDKLAEQVDTLTNTSAT